MSTPFVVESWQSDVSLYETHIRSISKGDIETINVDSMAGAGGQSGEMHRITLTLKEGKTLKVVLKLTKNQEGSILMSKSLTLYREAIFYEKLLHTFGEESVPTIYASLYDVETGRKAILMEDLSEKDAVQSGYFFGDNSFHNHNKDLAEVTKNYPGTTELDITKLAFAIAAKLHGSFWNSEDLLGEEYKYLKGQLWFLKKDEAGWLNSKDYSRNAWEVTKGKLATGECTTKYSDEVKNLLDSSFACTFAEYCDYIHHVPYTLTHGDFHPANFLTIHNPETKAVQLKVLDFEVIGLGSGAQDLGQFMVSHSFPEVRRANEKEVLAFYHENLVARLKEVHPTVIPPTMEDIHKEYVIGGLGRWVWLMGICSSICPDDMNQFFQNQLHAFLMDHQETVSSVKVIVPRP